MMRYRSVFTGPVHSGWATFIVSTYSPKEKKGITLVEKLMCRSAYVPPKKMFMKKHDTEADTVKTHNELITKEINNFQLEIKALLADPAVTSNEELMRWL